jgi:hypothetical protein
VWFRGAHRIGSRRCCRGASLASGVRGGACRRSLSHLLDLSRPPNRRRPEIFVTRRAPPPGRRVRGHLADRGDSNARRASTRRSAPPPRAPGRPRTPRRGPERPAGAPSSSRLRVAQRRQIPSSPPRARTPSGAGGRTPFVSPVKAVKATYIIVNIPRQSRGLYDVSRSKRLKTPLAWLLTSEGPAVASGNTRVFVTS